MQYQLSARFVIDPSGRAVQNSPEHEIAVAARHYRAREFATAARVCDAILERQPKDFDALHLRGVLHLEQGEAEAALLLLRRAEDLRPDDPQLIFHIGNALLALKRHAEAEEAFRRCLALQPGHFDALNNLGTALLGDGRPAEASTYFREAQSLRPDAPQPWYHLGRALVALARPYEAIACFRAVLDRGGAELSPRRRMDVHIALGEALLQQGRYDDALAEYAAVPADLAEEPVVQWNRSLTLLMVGAYAEGWRCYESRFLVPGHDAPREGAALLDLNAVAGRRVLVFPEQGRGDMIQFARYLPLLAARGAVVLVEMYADLAPLFALLPGVSQVVLPEESPPAYDLLTPLLSLPAAFGTELGTVPCEVPYLHVPESRLAEWDARLGPAQRRRVGVAWRGSEHSAKRSSMPVGALAPLLRRQDVEFHALQKEITPEDQAWLAAHANPARLMFDRSQGDPVLAGDGLPSMTLPLQAVDADLRRHDVGESRGGIKLEDHSAALADFADTAALIAHMDLVITIDTSVAHLAGALGKPVWIMLPFSPDWRWLCDRNDSPWYPTARLFRQKRARAWDEVVQLVTAALIPPPTADFAVRPAPGQTYGGATAAACRVSHC